MHRVSPPLMGAISVFRLIAGGIGLIFLEVHSSVSSATQSLQILLIGYMILTVGLILLWAYQLDHWPIIQGSLWCCDVVMATFLLVKFSQPTTAAPALLPALAYEAEAYWPRIGGVLGSLATVFLLILTWWLRLWSHRSTFSGMTLGFWLATLCLLTVFPILAKNLPGSTRTAESLGDGKDRTADRNTSITTVTHSEKVSLTTIFRNSTLLTPREQEIYDLMQTARSQRQIAQQLHLDYSTVKTHVRHIKQKLSQMADH